MVTFGETRAQTSRKCVAVQGVKPYKVIQKNKNCFFCTHSFLLWNNSLKMLIVDIFLLVKEPLVAPFSETRAVTLWNDIVKQGVKISKA